jgi:hypothetical protein
MERRTNVEVYEDHPLFEKFSSNQQYVVKPLLSSVPRKSEQQMASIKQWFTLKAAFQLQYY